MIEKLALKTLTGPVENDPMTLFNDWLKTSGGTVDSAEEAALYMRLLSLFSTIRDDESVVCELLGKSPEGIINPKTEVRYE